MHRDEIIAGRYRLEARLGEGAFGVVWSAHDRVRDRDVAIKFLGSLEPEMKRRFQVEARALRRLSHRGCVAVLDTGATDSGRPYLVMERVDGTVLAALRGQRLPIEQVIQIATQLADVLWSAHREGIVHRDLKPENIILVGRDVKVLDFGIARITAPELPDITKTGQVLGTPQYMSPEQLRGSREVGPATDQYALGVLLYELLEGRLPFGGDDLMAVGMAHITRPVPPMSRRDCPGWLHDVVMRLLAKDAHHRFVDARALHQNLVEHDPRPDPAAAIPAPRRRWPFIAAVAGVLVLVGGWWAVARTPAPGPRIVVLANPAALLKHPEVDVGALDVGRGPDLDSGPPRLVGTPTGSLGCREPVGADEFFADRQLPEVARYVPSSYVPGEEAPLVLLLHGEDEDAVKFMTTSGFKELADLHGLILVAPIDVDDVYDKRGWDHLALAIVRAQLEELCVNTSRIYVVGHSHGAIGADAVSCMPWVRATALSSHARMKSQDWTPCKGDPRPTITLWPMRSASHPVDGKRKATRCGRLDIAPLEEFEGSYWERHGCGRERTDRNEIDATCWRPKCSVEFMSCHIDGGHGWPGTPKRIRPPVKDLFLAGRYERCDGPDSKFEAARVVWEFFDSLPAQAEPPEGLQ